MERFIRTHRSACGAQPVGKFYRLAISTGKQAFALNGSNQYTSRFEIKGHALDASIAIRTLLVSTGSNLTILLYPIVVFAETLSHELPFHISTWNSLTRCPSVIYS